MPTARQLTLSQLLVVTAVVALLMAGVIYFPSAASVPLWSAALFLWYFWGPRSWLGAAAYIVVFGTLAALLLAAVIVVLVLMLSRSGTRLAPPPSVPTTLSSFR